MVGRLPGITAGFGPGMVTLRLQTEKPSDLAIAFTGAQAAIPQGDELQKSQSNYLLGDPSQWRTHVPNYGRVVYHGLYPGVDAVFYGHGQLLEHDFLVAPGTDYRQIRMRLSPDARATIDKDGSMTITIAGSELHMHKPLIYQNSDGARQLRTGSFQMLANGDIGFRVGSYDRSRTLIIDPVLSFSTYLSTVPNGGGFIATDSSGNNYVTGYTVPGFPVTPGSFPGCGTCVANEIVTYVSKLSVDGKSLIYSTLIGGNAYTQPYTIAVDANENALVAGITQASDFPTKNGQPTGSPSVDNGYGFLLSLSADGSSLNYATLLWGEGSAGTSVSALAVDSTGNAYITGDTDYPSFPITAGALNSGTPGPQATQVYLSEFSPAGALMFNATLGDADPQNGGGGPTGSSVLAVDQSGDVYIAGEAGTLWPTTSGAYLRQIAGSLPYATPFVMEVAPGGVSVTYSTYLDYAYQVSGIAILPGGNVFVAGSGAGLTYPTTPNAFQPRSSTSANSFLTELNATGTGLVYSTFAWRFDLLSELTGDGPGWRSVGCRGDQERKLSFSQSARIHLSGFFCVSLGLYSQPVRSDWKHPQIFDLSWWSSLAAWPRAWPLTASHRAHVAGGRGFRTLHHQPAHTWVRCRCRPRGIQTNMFSLCCTGRHQRARACSLSNDWTWVLGAVSVGTYSDQALIAVTNCGTLPLTISSVSAAASCVYCAGCQKWMHTGHSSWTELHTRLCAIRPPQWTTDNSALTLVSNASVHAGGFAPVRQRGSRKARGAKPPPV